MSNIESILPPEAHELLSKNPDAVLIDTRTLIEHSFVGHPVGAIHVPLKRPPNWTPHPDFISNVEQHVSSKTTPIILMCRSGARSMDAAKLLESAGYQALYNMEEGFEGDLDENKHRGNIGGWRFHNLPWQQS